MFASGARLSAGRFFLSFIIQKKNNPLFFCLKIINYSKLILLLFHINLLISNNSPKKVMTTNACRRITALIAFGKFLQCHFLL